jgi:hypothetical protein
VLENMGRQRCFLIISAAVLGCVAGALIATTWSVEFGPNPYAGLPKFAQCALFALPLLIVFLAGLGFPRWGLRHWALYSLLASVGASYGCVRDLKLYACGCNDGTPNEYDQVAMISILLVFAAMGISWLLGLTLRLLSSRLRNLLHSQQQQWQ